MLYPCNKIGVAAQLGKTECLTVLWRACERAETGGGEAVRASATHTTTTPGPPFLTNQSTEERAHASVTANQFLNFTRRRPFWPRRSATAHSAPPRSASGGKRCRGSWT